MHHMDDQKYDIIVIGGGPSGMMAAGRAGEVGAKVLILEKNNRLGKKLSITGGRRCNITNAEFDNDIFIENFKDAKPFLELPLSKFSVRNTFDFFEGRGLPLMVEARKRAFPQSEKAEDVCKVLIDYIEESGNVNVKLNAEVVSLVMEDKKLVGVTTTSGTFHADKIILATGGLAAPDTGSTGEGLSMLSSIGHTVKDPDPSLVPLKSPTKWVHDLTGTTVDNVTLKFVQNDEVMHEVRGRILFTHFGISGPTVINAARIAKDLLKGGPISASIDLYPDRTFKMLDGMVRAILDRNQKKLLKGIMKELVQSKLGDTVIGLMEPGVGELKVSSVSKAQRHTLVRILKDLNFPITDTKGFAYSIVADGGVIPEEVDFESMTSKLFPNLYLIGDTININRPSGGFSLQLCWMSGWIAGTHAASRNM
ncbi:aminoacetone oxidase family FAD-binding enzyme [Candidatus Uhrbacteria bacterium]|nr:aminoacetone oxidase family FAD-binding enzyme [Candidatus Uhrbacteria bacterium]